MSEIAGKFIVSTKLLGGEDESPFDVEVDSVERQRMEPKVKVEASQLSPEVPAEGPFEVERADPGSKPWSSVVGHTSAAARKLSPPAPEEK